MKASSELHEFDSEVMGVAVEVSVVLPPDFEQIEESLPLLINLHGGGGGVLLSGIESLTSTLPA